MLVFLPRIFSIFMSMYESFQECQFFTATNLNWMPLLKDERNKKVILDSLSYMVKNNRCKIYAFVIMPNHIHLILDLVKDSKSTFQRDFLRFTAQQCLYNFKADNSSILTKLLSTQNDRKYQFWERNPFWTPILSEEDLFQKISYIHFNPIEKKQLNCHRPTDYKWSSAKSFFDKKAIFGFIEPILTERDWNHLNNAY